MPQYRTRPIVDAARLERRHEWPAGEIIRSERGVGFSALDRSIHLAARRALLVDQHGFETELIGECRGGHTRGTCADDRELDCHCALGVMLPWDRSSALASGGRSAFPAAPRSCSFAGSPRS